MLISDMEAKLKDIREEHGDIPILLADRYAHYDVKRVNFSDACDGPHVCVRMEDDIKYGGD